MKIKKLHIKNFGKYANQNILFSEGLNIAYGDNEAGKTTIYMFIKAMLYGLERGRGRASLQDTFIRYEPWENPNYYAGELLFECGNKEFRLIRQFDKYSKKSELFCEEDGEVLSIENGDLQMLLEGMEESTFDNTVAVGQLKSETNQSLAVELKNYAVNYYLTGNGDLYLEDALMHLAKKKKNLEKEIKSTFLKRQQLREDMEREASYLWRDIHRFEQELEGIEGQIEVCAGEEQSNIQEQETPQSKWRIHPVELIGMIFALILTFVLFEPLWSNLIAVVLALAEGLYIWNQMKDGIGKRSNTASQTDMVKESSVLDKLRWKQERLVEEYKEKKTAYDNLQENIQELELSGEVKQSLERRRQALELAGQRLEELSLGVHKELSTDLNKKASQILSEITLQRYTKLLIQEDLKMSVYAQGKRIAIERLSRGTIEQIYFALRMAAAELLYSEDFPVILDDAFVFYDEKRLESTLRWLSQNKKQVIILTCQNRERKLLDKIKLSYKYCDVSR